MIVYTLLLTAPTLHWNVADSVLGIPGVIRADAVFGPADVIVKIEGEDVPSIYKNTIKKIGTEIMGVERTATSIGISEAKEPYRDPVDAYAFIEANPKVKSKILEALLKEEGICDAHILLGNYDIVYEAKGDLEKISKLSDQIHLMTQKYGGFKGITTMIVKKR